MRSAKVRYTRFMLPWLMRDQDYQFVQTSGGVCKLMGFILSFYLRDRWDICGRECCLDKYEGLNGGVLYGTTRSMIVRCAVRRQAIDTSSSRQ